MKVLLQKAWQMPKTRPSEHQESLRFSAPISPIRRPAPCTEAELLLRAQALAGAPVGDLAAALGIALPEEPARAKGFVGQLVEAALGADPKAFDRPDFPSLGVELKTIPLRTDGMPAESTFCCSISYAAVDKEQWGTSRLKQRLQSVLFLPVQASQVAPLSQRVFLRSLLWRPKTETMALLQADWEELMGCLGRGEIPSAHGGQILQLRPKAANKRVRTLGPLGEKQPPLGFYLRARFTARILAGEA